jgi:thymidylate kinase
MSIRIAISGAHGVGKTTICNVLVERLRSMSCEVTLITNVARDLAARGVGVDFSSSAEEYSLYVAEHVKRLLSAHQGYILHDRTLLDSFVYMRANDNASANFMVMMNELVAWYLRDVTHYFYVPIQFAFVDDGITRRGGGDYQKNIDFLIRNELITRNVPYVTVAGTIEERARKIEQLLFPLQQKL